MKYRLPNFSFFNKNILIYSMIFSVTLTFFIYLTFPYAVLKDIVAANIQKQTGYMVIIDSFGPSLPLGFKATKVSLSKVGSDKKFHFDYANVKINPFKLLIGKLGTSVSLQGKELGELYLYTSISIFSLLRNTLDMSYLQVYFDSFKVDDICAFALASLSTSQAVSPIIQPVLEDMILKGKVNGSVELNITNNDLSGADGVIDLSMKSASLNFGADMDIATQSFTRALIKGQLKKGLLELDNKSGLESSDLKLDFSGNLKLAKILQASNLNLLMQLKLIGALNSQFGFILNNFATNAEDGVAKFSLKGSLASPQFN